MDTNKPLARYLFWRSARFQQRRRAYGFALVCCIVLLTAWWQLGRLVKSNLQRDSQDAVAAEINAYGSALTRAIHQRISLLDGLSAFANAELLSHPKIEQDEFALFAAGLYESADGIQDIALAPGGVIQYVYPYEENKSVLGYIPAQDARPSIRADVQRAIATRQVVLSEPLALLQGGQGLIARDAVFSDGEYWGLTNLVLKLPQIFEDANLTTAEENLNLAIKDQAGHVFYGSADIFDPDANAVCYILDLPEGHWELAAVPINGWGTDYQYILLVYRVIGLLLVIALTLVAYQYARRYQHLASLVDERTQALTESEAQYRELVDNSLVGIYITQNYVIRFANQGLADLFGYQTGEEMVGVNAQDLVTPQSWEKVRAEVSLRESGQKKVSRYEFQGVRTDGSIFDIEALGVVIQYQGRPAMQGILIDISERVQAEKQLRKNEIELRAMIENSRDAIGVLVLGVHNMVNPAYLKMFGYKHEDELIGKPVRDLIAPSERARIAQYIQTRREGKSAPLAYQIQGCRKDGTLFDMDVQLSVYRLDDTIYTLAILRDITEQISIEKVLRRSQEEWETTFNAMSDWVSLIDIKTQKIIRTNRAGEALLGIPADEIVGRRCYELVHSTEEYYPACPLPRSIQSRQREDMEFYQPEYKRWLSVSVDPIINADGHVESVVHIVRDITESKKTEDRLRKSEERFRTAFHISPDAININRLKDGLYVDINEGFTKITGYTREEVIGKTSAEINIWHDMKDRQVLIAGLQKDGVVHNLETQFRMKDGNRVTGLMSARIILLDDVPHILSVTREIESIRAAKRALKQYARQLETLNTITTVLSTSLELEKVLDLILGQIKRVLPLDSGAVFLQEEDGLRVMVD
ncbi:MAG: PAS domain S-box protein, partial [Anaerolineales bacterium]|nr:PAS domain S-box protein [Anaerolineales bacterium]